MDGRRVSVGGPRGVSAVVGRAAGVAPERTNQSMSAANANDAASTANAAPTPTSATAKPATAGPTVPTSCAVPCITRVGGGQPLDRDETRHERVDGRQEDRVDGPEHDPDAASCHSSTRSPMTRPATIVVRTARTTFETSARSRGEIRSDRTPPTSRNTPRGMAAAMRIAPSAKPGAGQPEDEPRQRDGVELVAQERDALAQPDEAVVADRERREQREPADPAEPPTGCGRRRARSFDRDPDAVARRRRPRGWSP